MPAALEVEAVAVGAGAGWSWWEGPAVAAPAAVVALTRRRFVVEAGAGPGLVVRSMRTAVGGSVEVTVEVSFPSASSTSIAPSTR